MKKNATECEKLGFKSFIQTLVQVYLFKPTNFLSHVNENHQTNKNYIHGKKAESLHPYNADFKRTDDVFFKHEGMFTMQSLLLFPFV